MLLENMAGLEAQSFLRLPLEWIMWPERSPPQLRRSQSVFLRPEMPITRIWSRHGRYPDKHMNHCGRGQVWTSAGCVCLTVSFLQIMKLKLLHRALNFGKSDKFDRIFEAL